MSKTYEELLHEAFCKYMQRNHAKDWMDTAQKSRKICAVSFVQVRNGLKVYLL